VEDYYCELIFVFEVGLILQGNFLIVKRTN